MYGQVEIVAGGKGMIVLVLAVVIGLPLAAFFFGADSRDGRDWKRPSELPSPLAARDMAASHMAGGSGATRLVHRREHLAAH